MNAYMIAGSTNEAILNQINNQGEKPLTPSEYLRKACMALGLDKEFICMKSNKQEVVFPRAAVARGMLRKCESSTLTQIGRTLNKDHATILHYKHRLKEHPVWLQYEKMLIKSGL